MPANDPCFIAHQGTQAAPVLREFVQSQPAGAANLAATVFVPRYNPGTLEDMTRSLERRTEFVLADPETHRLHYPFADRGRGRQAYPYLQESDPITNARRFVGNVLRAQANAGRDVLVSPWLLHGTSPSMDHLNATLRYVDLARRHPLTAQRTLVLGLAITEGVLRTAASRHDFLDEVTEIDPGIVYLRISVSPTQSFTQYRDETVLTGLAEVVSSLTDNGFAVLLPQFGMIGWLMTAFGAKGFGAGISNSLHRFVPPASGFGQPLEWYFYEPVLGFVLRSEIETLNNALGIGACPCRYCTALPLIGRGAWDRNGAGLHFLATCAGLMNRVAAAAHPRDEVRTVVAAANANAEAVNQAGVVLDPRSVPQHLAVWSRVVV